MFFINKSLNSYESRSSVVFHVPKAKTSRFGLNTLRYDGANLWNKFHHKLFNLTKAKLEKLLQMHFLKFSSHLRLFCFFQFYCSQNIVN